MLQRVKNGYYCVFNNILLKLPETDYLSLNKKNK